MKDYTGIYLYYDWFYYGDDYPGFMVKPTDTITQSLLVAIFLLED